MGMEVQCVFWDEDLAEWSREGCRFDGVACLCNHTTSFAAMLVYLIFIVFWVFVLNLIPLSRCCMFLLCDKSFQSTKGTDNVTDSTLVKWLTIACLSVSLLSCLVFIVAILSNRYSPLATRHSPLTTRHSPLATRHLPLATHHSPLATRHSPHSSLHVQER